MTSFLRLPRVRDMAMASALARLPFGMGVVALIIFVHARTGSFDSAGAVSAGYTLAFAISGPVLGRLVDRRGARAVLLPSTLLCSLATLAVLALGEAGRGVVPMLAAAVVAGLTTPPVSGIVRRAWPELAAGSDLTTAYLLDSILIELIFIAGPLLTGLLSVTLGPGSPLAVSAALGLVGTGWFLAMPEIGGMGGAAGAGGSRAGALASPTIRLLVLAGLPMGFTFGALDVALPAFGALHGSTSLGGPFTAAIGAGSLLGALTYGVAGERLGDLRRTFLVFAAVQPLLSLPILLAPSPLVMLPLAMLAGSYAAPVFAVRNSIAHLTMPPGTATETFTWLLQSVMVGISAGSLTAGHVVESGGWRLGVALGIAVPIVVLPFLVTRRRLVPRAQGLSR